MSSSDKPGKRGFDSLAQETFLNLWRTYDRLRMFEEQLFGQYELTPQQYNALRLLKHEYPGNLPTLTLASKLVSRAPDITRLLDKLVERGLIERVRSDDNRRVVRVSITADGLQLLSELSAEVRRCHAAQVGHMPDEELRQLIRLLQKAREPHEPEDSIWLGAGTAP